MKVLIKQPPSHIFYATGSDIEIPCCLITFKWDKTDNSHHLKMQVEIYTQVIVNKNSMSTTIHRAIQVWNSLWYEIWEISHGSEATVYNKDLYRDSTMRNVIKDTSLVNRGWKKSPYEFLRLCSSIIIAT